MNHITECIIVRTIYFLIIRYRLVPTERPALHRHSGKSAFSIWKQTNLVWKCVFTITVVARLIKKNMLWSWRRRFSPRYYSRYLMVLLSEEQLDQHHGELSSPRPPADQRLKQYEISPSIIFKLYFQMNLCANFKSTSWRALFCFAMPIVMEIGHLFHTSRMLMTAVEQKWTGNCDGQPMHINLWNSWGGAEGLLLREQDEMHKWWKIS